ncbi:hypothetical protein [Massilia sp. YIM B04103]
MAAAWPAWLAQTARRRRCVVRVLDGKA